MLASKGFSTEDRLSAASGGNSTHLYTDSGDYKIHKFTADGTFTVNIPTILFDILVIAGGGSGAGTGGRGAGGAGDGGDASGSGAVDSGQPRSGSFDDESASISALPLKEEVKR